MKPLKVVIGAFACTLFGVSLVTINLGGIYLWPIIHQEQPQEDSLPPIRSISIDRPPSLSMAPPIERPSAPSSKRLIPARPVSGPTKPDSPPANEDEGEYPTPPTSDPPIQLPEDSLVDSLDSVVPSPADDPPIEVPDESKVESLDTPMTKLAPIRMLKPPIDPPKPRPPRSSSGWVPSADSEEPVRVRFSDGTYREILRDASSVPLKDRFRPIAKD